MYKVTRTIDTRLREIGLIYKVVRVDFDVAEFPIGYFSDKKYAAMVVAAMNELASVDIVV
jgi:hypothetical protein